jgi:hypothetical protein
MPLNLAGTLKERMEKAADVMGIPLLAGTGAQLKGAVFLPVKKSMAGCPNWARAT